MLIEIPCALDFLLKVTFIFTEISVNISNTFCLSITLKNALCSAITVPVGVVKEHKMPPNASHFLPELTTLLEIRSAVP